MPPPVAFSDQSFRPSAPMTSLGVPSATVLPMVGLEWNGSRADMQFGSKPARAHSTPPVALNEYTPPPEHCPPSAVPAPTNTWSLPAPCTSAAAGDELTGAFVAAGHPGRSDPSAN